MLFALEYANFHFQPLECGWEGFVSSRLHKERIDEKSSVEKHVYSYTVERSESHSRFFEVWWQKMRKIFPFLIHYWQPFCHSIPFLAESSTTQYASKWKDSLWLHPLKGKNLSSFIFLWKGNILGNPFLIPCTCWAE